MTIKSYIDIVRDVLAAIETDLLDATGAFKKQPDFADDAAVVSAVEQAYLSHGGALSDSVKRVIAGVVALLELV